MTITLKNGLQLELRDVDGQSVVVMRFPDVGRVVMLNSDQASELHCGLADLLGVRAAPLVSGYVN